MLIVVVILQPRIKVIVLEHYTIKNSIIMLLQKFSLTDKTKTGASMVIDVDSNIQSHLHNIMK